MAKKSLTKAQVKAAQKVTFAPKVSNPDIQVAEGLGGQMNPAQLPHINIGPGVDAQTLKDQELHNAQFMGEREDDIVIPSVKMSGGTVRTNGKQNQDSNTVNKSIYKINDEPQSVTKGTIGNKKTIITKR